MTESSAHREIVWRIKYSLINAVNLFSQEDSVELIPIIDRILLLFQKNIGIELIKYDNEACPIFSFSNRLGKATITEQWIKNKDKYLAGAFRFDENIYNMYAYMIDADDNKIYSILDSDKKNVVSLINLLNGNHGKLSEFLRTKLNQAFLGSITIPKKPIGYNVTRFKLTSKSLSSETATLCKDSIREILDDAFGSFSHNPLIFSEKFNITTFFTVIRYPFDRGDLEYSAQILLSGHQYRAIEDQLLSFNNKLPLDFSIKLFEDPLDGTSTSLADRCFSLDTVQFGLAYESKNQNEETPTDANRRTLEDEFYKRLLNNQAPANVFYVPIHVNGTAWIAIYRILPNDSHFDSWFLNFEMYNQYTLLIAEKIRTKAKEKYFSLLYLLIRDAAIAATDTEVFIEKAKADLDVLSAFFPYQVPVFDGVKVPVKLYEYLINIESSAFNLMANSLWGGTVQYDKIGVIEIIDKVIFFCKQIGASIKSKKLEEDVIEASYSICHLLKNRLNEPYEIVNGIKDNLDFIIDRDKLNLDKNSYHLPIARYEYIQSDLLNTLQILDLIPKSKLSGESIESHTVFKKKPDLMVALSIDLLAMVDQIATRMKVHIRFEVSHCLIEPFIENVANVASSPAPFLYDNCFVEVMTNYKKSNHAQSSANQLLIVNKCLDDSNVAGISFINRTDDNDSCHSDFREVSRKFGFHGAIGYLNTVLNMTGIGNIKKRIFELDGQKYFEVGFFLRGLKIS